MKRDLDPEYTTSVVLSLVTDDQLVEELERRGWILRHSTTGRYDRALIENPTSKTLRGER